MLEALRLDGRAAVVTGAGRGLGRAMATALGKVGARVVCAARTQAQIDETAAQIRISGNVMCIFMSIPRTLNSLMELFMFLLLYFVLLF